MTSPEHGHTRPAGKQDGTKDRRQAGLGDEPRRRTQHPRPDGRQAGRQDRRQEKDKPRGADTASQMKDKLRDKTKTKAGRQDQRQEKDKTREADRASQTRWETSWETRPETAQRGGHSIPDQMQGGHTKKALRTPTVNCFFCSPFGSTLKLPRLMLDIVKHQPVQIRTKIRKRINLIYMKNTLQRVLHREISNHSYKFVNILQ